MSSVSTVVGSSSHLPHGRHRHHDHSFDHLAHAITDENDIDLETARLIAELHLQDLAEIEGRRKGKGREGTTSDEEYALQLMTRELQNVVSISEDNRVAQSISKALQTDAAYLDAFVTAEQAAEADRLAAQALFNGQALPAPIPAQTRVENRDFRMEPQSQDQDDR